MNLFQRYKCFLNEEGASPGGGAAPPAPDQPPAQPAAPAAPALTADDIKSVVADQFKSLTDGLFANLRKSGALKQPDSPPPAPQPKKTEGAASPDPLAILALRDAFDDATSELKLTKGQRSLLREHVMRVQPGTAEVETMVSDFVSRAGWLSQAEAPKAPATSTTNPTVPVTPSPAPISDRGSPAPAQPVGWRLELAQNPLKMSAGAKQAMDAELGVDKARKQRLEAAQRFADMPVRFTAQG